MKAVVALTDKRWFDFLRDRAVAGRVDEVNFWRPQAQTGVSSLQVGEPFFFRLKKPYYCIAGYGFFSSSARLPIRLAWEAFAEGNGDPSLENLAQRIGEYRGQSYLETLRDPRELTCIVLRDAHFLPEELWTPWGDTEEWDRNVQAFKIYDTKTQVGARLEAILRTSAPIDLAPSYEPLVADERTRYEIPVVARAGQGAFHIRLLQAYERRCAVTGERSLPVLDAAHIQPYLGPRSNHVQNGIMLRADIHRLFDGGYVTVTPDYRFEVSARLKDEFENGRVYYALDGAELAVLPKREDLRPSKEALEWHATNVFR